MVLLFVSVPPRNLCLRRETRSRGGDLSSVRGSESTTLRPGPLSRVDRDRCRFPSGLTLETHLGGVQPRRLNRIKHLRTSTIGRPFSKGYTYTPLPVHTEVSTFFPSQVEMGVNGRPTGTRSLWTDFFSTIGGS